MQSLPVDEHQERVKVAVHSSNCHSLFISTFLISIQSLNGYLVLFSFVFFFFIFYFKFISDYYIMNMAIYILLALSNLAKTCLDVMLIIEQSFRHSEDISVQWPMSNAHTNPRWSFRNMHRMLLLCIHQYYPAAKWKCLSMLGTCSHDWLSSLALNLQVMFKLMPIYRFSFMQFL